MEELWTPDEVVVELVTQATNQIDKSNGGRGRITETTVIKVLRGLYLINKVKERLNETIRTRTSEGPGDGLDSVSEGQ